jgi:hypothetical protein
VIALFCRRFTQEQYARYFPADWYDETPRELVSRKPAADVRAFFEEVAERNVPQLNLLLFEPAAPRRTRKGKEA